MTNKVAFQRSDYQKSRERWDLIKDCLEGDLAIKKAGVKYLPQPNAEDTSKENAARYKAYVDRAVFYNVARRTLEGLVGQVFSTDPVVDIPDEMNPILDNASGSGISAQQTGKKLLRHALSYGRGGLYLDFPRNEGVISRADLLNGKQHPTLIAYDAMSIINWRTKSIDGQQVLSLVVLRETYDTEDEFEVKTSKQLRVLRLTEENVYQIELWKSVGNGDAEDYKLASEDVIIPRDSAGQPLKRIPFWFVGSVDNDPSVDESPLYDLCALNIAHYRNSADYEDSCWLVGQPTPWVSGLTQAWVDKNMNGLLQLGSRGVIPLPQGGAAGLLQATANTMPKEAMEHKERQMVALGAKLVENKQVQRTLGEAKMESATETSVLSSCAQNTSAALTNALRVAATVFYGIADAANLWYTLSTDFAISKMDPTERAQLVKEWQSGAISFTEMREQLRQSGVATLDDEAAKEEIESEGPSVPMEPLPGEPVVEGEE